MLFGFYFGFYFGVSFLLVFVFPRSPNQQPTFCFFNIFVLDDKYYISSVAIYTRLDGSGGYRLVYPTKKVGDKNINIFHPINQEVGGIIEKEVIKKLSEIFDER